MHEVTQCSLLGGRVRGLQMRIHALEFTQDLLARTLPLQHGTGLRITKEEHQTTEHVQVGPHRGADQGEERVYRAAVQGSELDRMLEEAQGDRVEQPPKG